MGKKILLASAAAAGGLLAVSNAMVNIALRRKAAPQAPKLGAAAQEGWLSDAKYITHRNCEDMRLRAWFVPQAGRRSAVICPGSGCCGGGRGRRPPPAP